MLNVRGERTGNNIKLVAIDIDGTLVDNDRNISSRNKEAIRSLRDIGVEVTLATGRMFDSAKVYADELELNLPLVTYQGALVKVSATGEILYERYVDASLAQQVVALAADKGFRAWFYLNDRVLVDKITPETREYAAKYRVPVCAVDSLADYAQLSPLKLIVPDYNEESLTRFELESKEAFGSSLHIARSLPQYLEFGHPEATKAKGIDAVVRYLGISPQEVMAIGDSWNDLEMLEYAGIAVVMGNARDDIKEKADYVTLSNQDHGVAAALEKLLLL
jgi:Cof subfamily protein (haloacid dehalogenase superfamily)